MIDRFPYGDYDDMETDSEAAYDLGWEQGHNGEPMAMPPEIADDLDLALQFELGYEEGSEAGMEEESDFPDEPGGNLAHVSVSPVRFT